MNKLIIILMMAVLSGCGASGQGIDPCPDLLKSLTGTECLIIKDPCGYSGGPDEAFYLWDRIAARGFMLHKGVKTPLQNNHTYKTPDSDHCKFSINSDASIYNEH